MSAWGARSGARGSGRFGGKGAAWGGKGAGQQRLSFGKAGGAAQPRLRAVEPSLRLSKYAIRPFPDETGCPFYTGGVDEKTFLFPATVASSPRPQILTGSVASLKQPKMREFCKFLGFAGLQR